MKILVLHIMHLDSDFWIAPKWSQSEKMIIMLEFVNMTSPSNLFNVVVFSLSSFVSKFHFNIITGFGVLTIFIYKGLTRNLGIGVFSYNWGVWRARDSKFRGNIFNKILLVAKKFHGESFYRFLVIKEKTTVA